MINTFEANYNEFEHKLTITFLIDNQPCSFYSGSSDRCEIFKKTSEPDLGTNLFCVFSETGVMNLNISDDVFDSLLNRFPFLLIK